MRKTNFSNIKINSVTSKNAIYLELLKIRISEMEKQLKQRNATTQQFNLLLNLKTRQ